MLAKVSPHHAESYSTQLHDQSTCNAPPSSICISLRALVKKDLAIEWQSQRESNHRQLTKTAWSSVDSQRVVLDGAFDSIDTYSLDLAHNKLTSMYWMQTAQGRNCHAVRNQIPSIVVASMYEEWARQYDGHPDIEKEHLFAHPIRVTANGPNEINDIRETHHSFYTQALEYLRARDTGHTLHPFYGALFLVIDSLDYYGIGLESDGYVDLQKVVQAQTVLICRTGLNSELSQPISLATLRPYALPSSSCTILDPDIIRVPLVTAVKFITGIANRKDALHEVSRSPRKYSLSPLTPPHGYRDTNVCHHPEAWADAVMQAADTIGWDKELSAKASLQRIKAGLAGEVSHTYSEFVWGNRWK